MRSTLRLTIVLGAIVVFCGGLASIASGQAIDQLLTKARQLEKDGRRHEALAEYTRVAREQSREPEVASEILYQGGMFASERYDGSARDKTDGEDAAVQMWRQILNDYPNTKTAAALTGGEPRGPNDKLAALESRIDKRNSKEWKYQMLNALVLLTGKNPAYSYAVALILLAVLVKVILLPLTKKQYAGMREMQRMQPMVKELQTRFKGAELSQKTMELYKEHKVNPFAGCWPTLIQLPFLILIFTAIREYEFAFANGKFLWVGSSLVNQKWTFMGYDVIGRNLATPDLILLAMYALTNYVTMKMTPASDPSQQQQQSTMAVFMSIFFFWMFLQYRWSSAFVLYWLALNLLSIWQQYEYIYKPHRERMQGGGGGGPAATATAGNGAGIPPASAKPVGKSNPPARVRPRKKKR